jgi:hypothetical protein
VYQKTRTFLIKKQLYLSKLRKKQLFHGAEEKIMKILLNSKKSILTSRGRRERKKVKGRVIERWY